MKSYKNLLVLGMSALVLSACEKETVVERVPVAVQSDVAVRSLSTARVVGSASQLECPAGGIKIGMGVDENNDGVLQETEVDSTEVICNGLNIIGEDRNTLVNIDEEPAGLNCSVGGYRFQVGLDTNSDQVLGESEVDQVKYVCSVPASIAGSPVLIASQEMVPGTGQCTKGGMQFRSGTDLNGNGELDLDETARVHEVCHGEDGANGYNSLLKTSPVVAGQSTQCPSGGIELASGLDLNLNGILDESEISDRQTVCHGQDGTGGGVVVPGGSGENGYTSLIATDVEAPGLNCLNGGLRVTSGLDVDRNSVLDAAEIEATNYVCAPGSTTVPSDVACTLAESASGGKYLQCGSESFFVDDQFQFTPVTVEAIDRGVVITDFFSANGYGSGGADGRSALNPTYLFEVTEPSRVRFTAVSADAANGASLALYTADGLEVDDIISSGEYENLSAGRFKLVVKTARPRSQANFEATIQADTGSIANVQKIQFDSYFVKTTHLKTSDLPESWRNPHYRFDVTTPGYVDFSVISDTPNGEVSLKLVGSQDWLFETVGLSFDNQYSRFLAAGTYELAYSTVSELNNLDVTMYVSGPVDNFELMAFQNASYDEGVGPSRGNMSATYFNPHYRMSLSESSRFDVVVPSSDRPLDIHVIGTATGALRGDLSSTNKDWGWMLPAGEYEVILSHSGSKLELSDQKVEFFGQWNSFTPQTGNLVTQTGSWTTTEGPITSAAHPSFTLKITESSSLGILIGSPGDISPRMGVFRLDGSEVLVANAISSIGDAGGYASLVFNLEPGDYRLYLGSTRTGQSGNYEMIVSGQFTDFVAE